MLEVRKLDGKVPEGPVAEKWDKHRFNMKLVNLLTKESLKNHCCRYWTRRSFCCPRPWESSVIMSMLSVLNSARRAHSIAAQGGINAAKNC